MIHFTFSPVRIMSLVIFTALLVPVSAQTVAKPTFCLRGKVEQVNVDTKRLTVSHPDIEGWMGAMTMAYAVDKPEILKNLKVGNQIKAKVYDGDYMLHDVELVQASKGVK